MTKQEFLDKLRAALNGKLLPGQVEENLHYYEDYINTEVRKGKSEGEVLAVLGDPRLIARTIVETAGQSADHYYDNGQSTQYREAGGNSDTGGNTYHQYGQREENPSVQKGKLALVPAWVWRVAVVFGVILILSAIFSVVAAILPVVLPILLVVLLVKIFRDWVN